MTGVRFSLPSQIAPARPRRSSDTAGHFTGVAMFKRGTWRVDKLPTPNEPADERPPWWQDRALGLVRVYNQCVVRVNAQRVTQKGIRSPNETTLEVMWGLYRWCRELGVDAASWVYAVHAAMGWKRPAGQRNLFSKGHRRTYDTLGPSEFGNVTGMLFEKAQPFRPFVDLSIGAERAKATYALRNRPDLCLLAIDVTYGFHHSSPHCVACSKAPECAARTRRLKADQ